MIEKIAHSEKEWNEFVLEYEVKQGMKLGCCSNAGLPHGSVRMTFVPKEAFKEQSSQEGGK